MGRAAGHDLSILPITEDFLKETCPQAFIDEGLDKYTHRDKIHSLQERAGPTKLMQAQCAVCCISWCTPKMGFFKFRAHDPFFSWHEYQRNLWWSYGGQD